MTKRLCLVSIMCLVAIAIMFAMLFAFTIDTAYAEDTGTVILYRYIQNLDDDEYSLESGGPMEISECPVGEYNMPIYDYCEIATDHTNVTSGTVEANETLVLTVYLNRKEVTHIWKKGEDTLDSQTVRWGTNVEYGGETPTKQSIPQYSYSFTGWVQDPDPMPDYTATITYTAQFDSTLRSYTITWMNGDTILETDEDVPYGETPEYNGATPEKEPDDEFSYTFDGWDSVISAVDGDKTYKAKYSTTTNTYTVKWFNGTELLETDENVPYGETPEYNGAEPTKEADAQFTYAFDGWEPGVSIVTGNVDYFAKYTITINEYQIKWVSEDTELRTDSVPYGTIPNYGDTQPVHSELAGYSYPFIGWSPEVVAVTGDATYTAQYSDPVANKYTITYNSLEGNFSGSFEVTYGEYYQFPTLTYNYFWLKRWVDDTDTVLAMHDGESLNVYNYTNDIVAVAEWENFEINLASECYWSEDAEQTTFNIQYTATGPIVFFSSDENVATVDENGKVTFVGKGVAPIFLKQADGAYMECMFVFKVDKAFNQVHNLLFVTINEGMDNKEYAFTCDEELTVKEVSDEILAYLEIDNAYVSRTDLGVKLHDNELLKDVLPNRSTLNINLIYKIEKKENTAVSFKFTKNTAEYNTLVYLDAIVVEKGYTTGRIVATSEATTDITIDQGEKSILVSNGDIVVDVLVTVLPIDKSDISKASIKFKNGVSYDTKVSLIKKDKDAYNQSITIDQNKEAIYVIHIDLKKNNIDVNDAGEYVLTMPVPEEFVDKDGMVLLYLSNGKTVEKQIIYNGDMMSITLMGTGDFVFAANVHASTIYLYWLIVLLLFLDAILGMILAIMATAYSDALARRKELNGYSIALAPIMLLGAVIAGEIAVVAFLGLVLVIEVGAIAWLGLKLTNKYFIYTTYHKIYRPKNMDDGWD